MYTYNQNGQKVPMQMTANSHTKKDEMENYVPHQKVRSIERYHMSNKDWLWVGVGVVVLLLVVLAVWWLWKKHGKPRASFGCGMNRSSMGLGNNKPRWGFRFY